MKSDIQRLEYNVTFGGSGGAKVETAVIFGNVINFQDGAR